MIKISRKSDTVTIWPVYLDCLKTRSQGRMIPKSIAVESPSAEEIFDVCSSLSYSPVLEAGKRMPSSWWERSGRVIVTKKGKKLQILKEVSKALQRKRLQKRKP